jgi:hypothetical protein
MKSSSVADTNPPVTMLVHHVSALRQRLARKTLPSASPTTRAIRFSSSMFALHGATNASAVIAFHEMSLVPEPQALRALKLASSQRKGDGRSSIRGTPLGVCRQGRHEVAILRAAVQRSHVPTMDVERTKINVHSSAQFLPAKIFPH